MRTRREVLIAAAAGVVTVGAEKADEISKLTDILPELERALMRELPGLRKVQIEFRPADEQIPLMIHAYRI
jgi:regulator of RNase E activity RraA